MSVARSPLAYLLSSGMGLADGFSEPLLAIAVSPIGPRFFEDPTSPGFARARRLREEEEIDGGDVLPGFRCRVGDFFPPPAVEIQSPNV
jgi:hypothetical protein